MKNKQLASATLLAALFSLVTLCTCGSSDSDVNFGDLHSSDYRVVAFNKNGGSGTAPDAIIKPNGSPVIIPAGSGLTRGGSVFVYWNTLSDDGGERYFPGGSYTANSDLLLYAIYGAGQSGGAFLDGTWARGGGTYAFTIDSDVWVYSQNGRAFSRGTWSSNAAPAASASGTLTLTITHVDQGSGWAALPSEYNSVRTNTAAFSINADGTVMTISNARYTTSGVWGTLEGTYTREGGITPATYTLTVSGNPVIGGAVTPESAQTGLAAGTTVNISARAADGYRFSNWMVYGYGEVANANSAATYVTVNGNVTVTAYFIQLGSGGASQFNPEVQYGTVTAVSNGQTYRTIAAGGITWMAENLNSAPTGNSWCYADNQSNCDTYGRLYDWNTALDVCSGVGSAWRLPTRQEWNNLVSAAGSNAGRKLKSAIWSNGTDDLGFAAMPGGGVDTGRIFYGGGVHGYWWTSNEANDVGAYGRNMFPDSNRVGERSYFKVIGMSVRCVTSATIAPPTYYSIMVGSSSAGGTTVPAGQVVNAPAGVGYDILAIPADGYTFVNWTVTGSGTISDANSAAAVLTPSGNMTAVANFTENVVQQYTLAVSSNPTAGGTTTPVADGFIWVEEGQNVAIGATASSGYEFSHWTVVWCGTLADANSASTTVAIGDCDVAVTANFTAVEPTHYTITVSSNPSVGGTTVPPQGQVVNAPAGVGYNILAVPADGYTFVNWTTTGSGSINNANSAAAVLTPSGNMTAVANFAQTVAPTYTLTVNSDPSSGGAVTPSSPQTGIAFGATRSITATPASGYVFGGWTVAGNGIVVDPNNPVTSIIVNGNVTVTATFQERGDIISDTFTDGRDDKVYRSVKIGTQTWMAENLNYDTDGSICYNDAPGSCDTYGRRYDWVTAMAGAASSATSPSGVRGVCPVGWHLPSNAEWTVLTDAVGDWSTVGAILKADSELWIGGGGGRDDFGFAALPGGIGQHGASIGEQGWWWTATATDAENAWLRSMRANSDAIDVYHDEKGYEFSVRCVKNE